MISKVLLSTLLFVLNLPSSYFVKSYLSNETVSIALFPKDTSKVDVRYIPDSELYRMDDES